MKPESNFLISWQAPGFVKKEHSARWNAFIFVALVFLLALGLFTDNFFLSIISIVFGLLVYLFERREPQIYTFGIKPNGIFAQDHVYEFPSLRSFWIFFEVGARKELSLKSKKGLLPFIRIPLGEADPVEVRKILLDYLPEKKQKETLLDAVEDVFQV